VQRCCSLCGSKGAAPQGTLHSRWVNSDIRSMTNDERRTTNA